MVFPVVVYRCEGWTVKKAGKKKKKAEKKKKRKLIVQKN